MGNGTKATSDSAPEEACKMVCAGDSTKLCGGPMLLSLYKYASDSKELDLTKAALENAGLTEDGGQIVA